MLQSGDEGEVLQWRHTERSGHLYSVLHRAPPGILAANDIDAAAKQRAILLSSGGAETYQLIRNMGVPHKPADKSFKQLVSI